jgi:hypothetical protein
MFPLIDLIIRLLGLIRRITLLSVSMLRRPMSSFRESILWITLGFGTGALKSILRFISN